jgi:tetratricopeptide (TPR) repeat protein
MKKSFLSLLFGMAVTITGMARQLPDAARLSKMSPAELEVYKQQLLKQASTKAKQLSAQYNIKIDETTLPDYEVKAPVKDLKRLRMIPLTAPSMAELSAMVRKSERQLQTVAPPAIVQEVKTMAAKQDGAQLQNSSAGQWLNNNPVQALLLSMESALKSPDEAAAWNNLAALYNMTGLEHEAVPILQTWLLKLPNNAMLLNNMGQAYLGLGDLSKAKDYLNKCLSVDELNPEANHSMGIIAVFSNQTEEALSYFSRELQVAYRRSTMAQIKRMGRSVNLLQLRKKKTNKHHRDLFEEIGLSKFHIPTLPGSTSETATWKSEKATLMKNLQAELFFWYGATTLSDQERAIDGKRNPGLYSDLADELLSEHGDQYAPLLGLIRPHDTARLREIITSYYDMLSAVPCPQPPNTPGGGEELIKAYAKKCCSLHTPIVDNYMSEHNGFIKNRLDLAIANWKSYINGCVDIEQLAPTNAGKKSVYKVVADYFGFLITSLQVVAEESPPAECMVKMTEQEADAIITANHDPKLDCPDWLKIKVGFSIVSLEADCSHYALEGGEGLLSGYEKNFKTGVSTWSIGAGVEANYKDWVEAGVKQMVYISYDNNGQVSDYGLKGSSEVGTVIAGAEAGYTLGINSGWQSNVNGKGILKDFINLSTQL